LPARRSPSATSSKTASAAAGVLAAIAVAAVVSFAVADPFIAFASALAFLLSELADMLAYTPLRARSRLGDRRWTAAVVVSNLVGTVADTVVFLGVAFGAAAILPALPGQLVGKAWATVIFLAIGWVVGRALLREPQHARGA
jgi:uncharacterized PurR-regulated membrane protein YhhQ (DUF165 family)